MRILHEERAELKTCFVLVIQSGAKISERLGTK